MQTCRAVFSSLRSRIIKATTAARRRSPRPQQNPDRKVLQLPPELLLLISEKLPPHSRVLLSQTCPALQAIWPRLDKTCLDARLRGPVWKLAINLADDDHQVSHELPAEEPLGRGPSSPTPSNTSRTTSASPVPVYHPPTTLSEDLWQLEHGARLTEPSLAVPAPLLDNPLRGPRHQHVVHTNVNDTSRLNPDTPHLNSDTPRPIRDTAAVAVCSDRRE
ncbi:Uncharacterized protein TPAR_08999 [Tolypocladium paradoxum]|uniref:F-box domain-containing protein n=1 Tax=Tolypocladium paradoxum TaxID=94208 RepID=A0A2S4KTN6_9HYPO|nr:Uncharacterized protein TPAR_08999 [Tolypocladium paradoxum]